ncbi:hypothetical protein FAR15_25055, partial [Klebsiella pneumoniae]
YVPLVPLLQWLCLGRMPGVMSCVGGFGGGVFFFFFFLGGGGGGGGGAPPPPPRRGGGPPPPPTRHNKPHSNVNVVEFVENRS